MGDEQAVGIATAALFKLGTEPGALQSPSWYRSLHHFSRKSLLLLLELKLLLSTLHPSSPGCPASAASSQRWSPASALWAPAAAAGQHRAPRRWPCWGCHSPLCLPMMASIAVGLGSAPSSAIASFDTLLSIQRYRGIVLCTALRYIWAARLCFHKWQRLR